MISIQDIVRNRRKELGLTLEQLQEISGIPITTIHAYEKGTDPSLSRADELLKALGIELVIGRKAK